MEKTFGTRVKDRLKKLNETQSWLAEQCGVSNNAVAKWIKTSQITLDNASKIADALSTSVDVLLGKNLVVAENEIERQILFFYRNITEDHKNDIESLANNLYNVDNPDDIKSNPRIIKKDTTHINKHKVIHLGDVEEKRSNNES